MDPVSVGRSLVDAGGWTAFVILVVAGALAVVRGDVVPGWIYRRELERSDRVEAAMANLTKAVDQVSDDIVWNQRERFSAGRPPSRRRDA